MGKVDTKSVKADLSRRYFLKGGAAAGGAVALAGLGTKEANAQNITWNKTADIIIVGAGVSGLSAA